MAEKDNKLHIVLFPWLAFGHMIPYLEFAKLIAQKGHRVSFLCTPRNIDRLPKLPPNLINFVNLPLPHVEGLPDEDAEATIDVPYHNIQYLKKAYDGLQESVTLFLQTSNPNWIIYDFAPYWVAPIASKLGIKTSFFSIFIAPTLGFLGPTSVLKGESSNSIEIRTKPEDYTVPPKWIDFPTTVAFRYFEIKRIFDSTSPENVSGVSDLYRMGAGIESCDVVAIRGCIDFEPEWIRLLRNIYNKPVLPIGQLSPSSVVDQNEFTVTETWSTMKNWLDKQEKGSVVYVAFGSEAKLGQEEVTEIALGLEMSQLPFFWALRLTQGTTLPEGFEERIGGGRGVVWKGWVPQLKILAHDSVGGHFTHSGWSSVVESVRFQRAMILLPLTADQGIYARILEEKKMGFSVPRNERDGSFTSNGVAESLRLLMLEENGKIYRDKVKEMSGLFGDMYRQNRYLDTFLDYLKSH